MISWISSLVCCDGWCSRLELWRVFGANYHKIWLCFHDALFDRGYCGFACSFVIPLVNSRAGFHWCHRLSCHLSCVFACLCCNKLLSIYLWRIRGCHCETAMLLFQRFNLSWVVVPYVSVAHAGCVWQCHIFKANWLDSTLRWMLYQHSNADDLPAGGGLLMQFDLH